MRLSAVRSLALAAYLLGGSGCSIWWRYLVPSGRELYSVQGPASVRFLVEGSMHNGFADLTIEIINDGRSPLLVRADRIEVIDAVSTSLPVSFPPRSVECDGRTHQGFSVLGFREQCRVRVIAHGIPSLARTGEIILHHRGIARDGRWVPISLALARDAR
jgi:hypothetical protein